MWRRFIITAFLLILILSSSSLFSPVFAQDSPTWPPDPAVIFAEGVEVIDAKEIAPRPTRSTPQPSETRCGRLILDPPDAEVVLIRRDEQFPICELATGKLSQPMPPEADWRFDIRRLGGETLLVSPDDKWVAYISTSPDWILSLLAYERATGRLVRLGYVPHEWENDRVLGWATNTALYFTSRDTPEWTTSYAYVATVPVENSVRQVMYNWRFRVSYRDDPPRFEKMITPGNDERYWFDHQLPIDCTRHVYDIVTQVTTVEHYGAICLPEYTAKNGAEYYRDIQGNGKTWLIRFNTETRERKNLYYGEIERLHWVAEDEHYALVTLDTSGKTECRPGFEWTDIIADGCWDVEQPVITLVDLTTGKTLFSSLGSAATIGFSGRYATAIDDHTLTISYSTDYWHTSTNFYLQLENGHADVQVLDGYPDKYLVDQRLILQLDASGEHNQYMVYDPVTHTKRLITNKTSEYYLSLGKVEGNTATITASIPTHGYADEPPAPKMQYTVNLPS